MKGDFSKDTFDARRHFSAVKLQQGRVVTDADWNEQHDLARHRVDREAWDVIGNCGAPEAHAGFALAPGTFALAMSAVGDDVWIAGEDGAILRTLDGGAHWTALDAGVTTHLRAVRFASSAIGWAVGDGGVIVKTTDGGASWTAQSSGVQVALLGLAVFGTTQAWAVGENGALLRTSDGGTTWVPSTVGSGRLYAVHLASATAGWIVGQDGGIWTTIDGGTTWTSRGTAAQRAHLRAVAFVDAVTGWTVGDGGTVRKTVDGGATWTSQNAGVTTALRAVAVRSAAQVLVAGDGGEIRQTNDGGTTWQAVDGGQTDIALRAIALGVAPHAWIAGDGSLVRLDGGSPGAAAEPLLGVSFSIEPGRLYVKGVLCEADERASFYNQPDRHIETRLAPGAYVAYLDVWQRYLSYLEAPNIREVALGGPDTAGRAKTVWQVRTLALDDVSPPGWTCLSDIPGWAALTAKPTARLRARAEPEQVPTTLCEIGAAGGFRRVENQLYRVEVQEGGGAPTFKWSRENGSVAFAITGTAESGGRTTVTLATRALDDNLDLVEGGWVEVIDDDVDDEHGVGVLRRFIGRGNDPLEVVLDGTLGSVGTRLDKHPLLRRWEHKPSGGASALPIQEGVWLPLEDGVEVFFDPGGTYRPGDFWQIPARTITADVEWPRDEHGQPVARPPAGIEHRYCRLALIDVGFDGAVHVTADCRELFPPLTALTLLLYASGDGQDGVPGKPLPQPLRARVTRGSHPVANAVVRFEVTSGGGQLAGAAPGAPLYVMTDADGFAECRWTLDADFDPARRFQTVDARLLDAASQPEDGQRVVFCASGTIELEYVSGDGQQALASQPVAHSLEVRVVNGQQGIAGVPVHFAVTQGGGALGAASPVPTGADGVASIGWTLGAAGPQRVEAEIRAADASRVEYIGFNADIPASSAGHGGCATTIGPDGGEFKQLTDDVLKLLLEKFKRNVCICFLPGAHEIPGIDVSADQARLSIHGCGHVSVVRLLKPFHTSGFQSVEISSLAMQMNEGAGFLFEKCNEVALQSLSITANPSNVPTIRVVAASSTVTVSGCSITTKLPGLAAVFDDAAATIRFTDNSVRGVLSFYGIPVDGQKLDINAVQQLMQSMLRDGIKINAAPGSLFLSRNTLETVTISREKFAELQAFAAQQRDTLDNLFRTAAVTDNTVTAPVGPLVLAATVSDAGLSLPRMQLDPLGVFVAGQATALGTIAIRDDRFRLAVVTPRAQAVGDTNTNLPFILKN